MRFAPQPLFESVYKGPATYPPKKFFQELEPKSTCKTFRTMLQLFVDNSFFFIFIHKKTHLIIHVIMHREVHHDYRTRKGIGNTERTVGIQRIPVRSSLRPQALGISGISANVHSWTTKANDFHKGAQIDLLIDRTDNCINICEIKFNSEEFSIDKKYDTELSSKISIFKEVSKTRKNVFLTMITANGLKRNQYSSRVAAEIDAEKLFL